MDCMLEMLVLGINLNILECKAMKKPLEVKNREELVLI